MRYDIFSSTAPAMPKPSKGTEICKLLLSQASPEMRETLVPMAIPVLAAHLSDVKFMYSDNKYYDPAVLGIRICNPSRALQMLNFGIVGLQIRLSGKVERSNNNVKIAKDPMSFEK